jgi:beta-lactamase class A
VSGAAAKGWPAGRPVTPRLLPAACALLLALPGAAAAQQWGAQLEARLGPLIAAHEGVVGVAVIDLRDGSSMGVRADEPFPSASLIKLPLLVELHHQVRQGRLGLDDPLVMLEADKVPGSGILQHLRAPHRMTVGDAAYLMIAISDNTATNLVIDKVGIRSVWERMEAAGLPRTKLHSKTWLRQTSVAMDSSVVYGLGVTTPMEMARLLAMLYHGELVSGEASRAMLDLLRLQQVGEGIPRGLPQGTSVAHKTGSISRARHDCGIVFTGGGDFVLCVMTRENADETTGVDSSAYRLIGELSRAAYGFFSGADPPGG